LRKRISSKTIVRFYRFAVAAFGLGALIGLTLKYQPTLNWPAAVIIAIVVGLQVVFPTRLAIPNFSLVHLMIFSGGLLYGPILTGWAVIMGITAGITAIKLFEASQYRNRLPEATLENTAFTAGLLIVPLCAAMFSPIWIQGLLSYHQVVEQSWYVSAAPLLLFPALHTVLLAVDFLLQCPKGTTWRDFYLLFGVLEILLPPIVFGSVVIYAQIDLMILATIGMIISVQAFFIHRFNTARTDLERRVRELSVINQLSVTLSSTLELEDLLSAIQQQVSRLFGVDNFYVALTNEERRQLWYPLAVKRGQRCSWAARKILPDRLTDKVIHEGKHLIYSSGKREQQFLAGLPPSDEEPYAWMGVPMISADKIIGCLAVFSLSPDSSFSEDDVSLLSTLSAQASVAAENALLFQREQLKATQMENLNRITALISASLDQKEVLSQVCKAVVDVGGAQRSAIFLLDPQYGHVYLAKAFGLSERFELENATFSSGHNERMRCLRTGRPVLLPNMTATLMELAYQDSLKREGVNGYGEFPMITPDGRIGFLAVYYDAQHTFQQDEEDLLQAFASQAALSVSNARLYANTDLALQRRVNQLSILEAVGREFSAAISSDRLFDLILNYAFEFTNSNFGEFSLYNEMEQTLEVKASRGYPENRTHFSVLEGLAGKAVVTKQSINSGEISAEQGYIDLTGGKAQSKLCIPLLHEGRVLGVLTLESEKRNAYSTNDHSFINQLANQAAVVVVNAELYVESQRRLREQSILYLVSQSLVSNPGFDTVVQTLTRSMESVLPASRVGIYLWDAAEKVYTLSHSSGRPECSLPAELEDRKLVKTSRMLENTSPLWVEGKRQLELVGGCTECSVLVFPLIASKQRLGLVLLHLPKDLQVREEELQLMRAVVSQVAISLQNALLFSYVTQGRDRLAAIINSVGEGILMVDMAGRIVLVNEVIQKFTGLPCDELLEQNLLSLSDNVLDTFGFKRVEAEGIVQTLAAGKEIQPQKTIISLVDQGAERVLERVTVQVEGQEDAGAGWLIVLRDVTEEHQIAQARELLTGTLIHDLRSPISAVIGAVDILESSITTEKRDYMVTQAFQVINSSNARVLGLVESLLDIAKMQSGKMELTLTKFNLHHLTKTVLTGFDNQANEYEVTFDDRVPDDILEICGDQSKIIRVIENLIDNALKFTPAGGNITVTSELIGNGMVAVKIIDSGPGIPVEYREKIFDRFTQIPHQRGRRRGSGLGLTFCRMAVEAHRGKIWVEERPAPETGSIFVFTLPVIDQ